MGKPCLIQRARRINENSSGSGCTDPERYAWNTRHIWGRVYWTELMALFQILKSGKRGTAAYQEWLHWDGTGLLLLHRIFICTISHVDLKKNEKKPKGVCIIDTCWKISLWDPGGRGFTFLTKLTKWRQQTSWENGECHETQKTVSGWKNTVFSSGRSYGKYLSMQYVKHYWF